MKKDNLKKLREKIIIEEIDKLRYISINEKSVLLRLHNDPEIIMIIFQERLHDILNEYLNTPIILSNRKSVSSQSIEILFKYFQQEFNFKNISINNLPELLVKGNILLETLINQYQYPFKKKDITVSKVFKENYNFSKSLINFFGFAKNFTHYANSFIVHGSCADLEITKFSDLDTFMIIKGNTVKSVQELIDFKILWQRSLCYLYSFDCLQHHPHMFATEIDVLCFPYHWLPPQVFTESKSLFDNQVIHLNLYKNKVLIFRSFLQLAQRFRNPDILNKTYNEYTFKNDLSVISLFPTLLLQGINIDTTKKDSFQNTIVKELDLDNIFETTSKIREEWNPSLISKLFISLRYSYIVKIIYLKFIIRKLKRNPLLLNSMFKESFVIKLQRLIFRMSAHIITTNHE
jgi:hypothetical protein